MGCWVCLLSLQPTSLCRFLPVSTPIFCTQRLLLITYLQVVSDGNAQLQKLVDVAKESAANGGANTTALLANMSAVAKVQQGSLASDIRAMSNTVGTQLAQDPNYHISATLPALADLKTVSYAFKDHVLLQFQGCKYSRLKSRTKLCQ